MGMPRPVIPWLRCVPPQVVFVYNSYQSIIRGGHVWLRMRIADEKVNATAIIST